MQRKAYGAALALIAVAWTGAASAASMDLSHDIEARGAKPAWSLKVASETQFTLVCAGKPAVHATAPGAMITPQGASWNAKTADGGTLQVGLDNHACSLGSKAYPMAARVTFGGETLSGCAGPAAGSPAKVAP